MISFLNENTNFIYKDESTIEGLSVSKVHKFVITNPDLCIACNACMKTCIKHAYKRGKLSKKRLDVLR